MAPGPRFDVHVHLTRYWRDHPAASYRPDLAFTLPSLLGELDRTGIGGALALPSHLAPTVAATLEEGRALAAESRGRLWRATTVDPTRGREEVERAVELWDKEAGLAAIKLFPGYLPFYPHDPRLDPLYEFARRKRLPVFFHEGDTLDRNGLVKYARPIEIDEVAVRWRDVRFVVCHLGNPWVEEAAEIVYKNENVYADTSGLLAPERLPYYPAMWERARAVVAGFVATVGSADRLLYGSDWPLVSVEASVRLVRSLEIPVEDQERILGANARALLRPATDGAEPGPTPV